MKNKLFLYSGLSLLTVAIVTRSLGAPFMVWILTLSVAVLLKGVFVTNIIRSKDFKISLWLILIIIGVLMILLSLVFKYIYPVPFLRNILFYGAILLKVSGLFLMFVQKIHFSKKENKL